MSTNIKQVFKDLFEDSEGEINVNLWPREISWEMLPAKAVTFIGVRRAGKSSLLKQMGQAWSTSASRLPIYINFSDDRLFPTRASDLSVMLDSYEEWLIEKHKSLKIEVLWLLDEIQLVEGWEFFVDRLLRKPHYRVALSGSSAKLLSREVATEMRGRGLPVEVFPLSWNEFCHIQRIETSWSGTRQRAKLKSAFLEYLKWGGFPEVQLTKNPLVKRTILQDYFETVVLRDVVERHGFSKPLEVKACLKLLFSQMSSLFTAKKLIGRLTAMGFSVSKNLIPEILAALEDCYAIFSVPLLTHSHAKQQINPRKAYVVDTGWANAVTQGLNKNLRGLLENAVFLHLRRNTQEIFYAKDAKNREVDFVVKDPATGDFSLIQSCWTINSEMGSNETLEREVAALRSQMAGLKIKKALIVTFEDEKKIKVSEGTIHVIPAPLWFLESM